MSSQHKHEIFHRLTVRSEDLRTILRKSMRLQGENIPDRFEIEAVFEQDSRSGKDVLAGIALKWLGDDGTVVSIAGVDDMMADL